MIACAFWDWKKINLSADKGDFVDATRRINGGTTGLQDRIDWLHEVQAAIGWPLPDQDIDLGAEIALPLADLKAVQVKLQALGLYAGSIDGIFGNGSRTALKVFQAEHGLPKTGQISRATLDMLDL